MCDTRGCSCSSHGADGHRRALISDIHSCVANEFCGAEIAVPDTAQTAQARERLSLNPDSARALCELGDALVYQMRYREAVACFEKAQEVHPDNYDIRRKLAARYLSTLRIEEAEEYFKWCGTHSDDRLDSEYRLALCAYYRGDYDSAAKLMRGCYPLCADNGEMYVAVLYWELICLVKLKQDISPTLARYREDLQYGHHLGYMLAIRLFLTDDLSLLNQAEGHGELAASIYLYGLYHYYLYKGKADEALDTLEYASTLDTYFSSFAYIGIYLDKQRMEKASLLRQKLLSYGKTAIALSGGVDSVYLAYAAVQAGADATAYFVNTAFQPNFEKQDALRAARDTGVALSVIDVDVLSDNDVIANPQNRCYYCKRGIMGAILKRAREDGCITVIDGTNYSDGKYERAGVKALREYGVLSPLAECGLTKQEIRQLSREAGLFTADKPSYSCLATRIATGEQITAQTLAKIEQAETLLFDRGYTDFRVRVSDNRARLEINAAQKDKITGEFDDIRAKLDKLFDEVTLGNWR